MEIKLIKAKKAELEKEIAGLIERFETETDTKIISLDSEIKQISSCSEVYRMHKIKLTIEL